MAKLERNFIRGRMNKSVDERLTPNGEYLDAINVRLGSTEQSEIGSVENSKGNLPLTALSFGLQPLSATARCIGAVEDGANETIYWFVHDNNNPVSPTGKCDMVVSFDTKTSTTIYHVVSTQDPLTPTNTTLNFNPEYLITGSDKIDDLLFWTDDYNAPRRINVTSSYPQPALGVDQITNAMINVIVKPPSSSPTTALSLVPGQENYMEIRFIAFAYRYKYENGEYSALSQFSDVAFEPGNFFIDIDNYINGAMVNEFNSARVTFDTGDSLVTDIDVCFKFGDDTIVRVIQKYNKAEEGWADNILQDINFSNSKIYTVLTEGQILRLYDNVPRYAKAQTIMGNRLMYGNYVDGYDLIDENGNECNQTFVTELVSTELGLMQQDGFTVSATFDFPGVAVVVPSGAAVFQLNDIMSGPGLIQGATISFIVEFAHWDYVGADITLPSPPMPPPPTSPFGVEWTITLQQDYNTVQDLVLSTEWNAMVGMPGCPVPALCNIQTVPNCALGTTVTDFWNCTSLTPVGFTKVASGRVGPGETPLTSVINDTITMQFLCMQYEVTGIPADNDAYQLFRVAGCKWVYNELGNKESLHSDRDFETAIIYMDEYNRATTALVSDNNTVNVPCFNSNTKNQVKVTLPTNMAPPEWAVKYKWAMKPSEQYYETIYTNIYYIDPLDGSVWFKLDGENQLKVEVGDILNVKRDTNGAMGVCVTTSVLDKVVQTRDFLDDGAEQEPGLYMRMKPQNFSTSLPANFIFGGTTAHVTTKNKSERREDAQGRNMYPFMAYDLYETGPIMPWDIVAGGVVSIYVKFKRPSRGCGGACGLEECVLDIHHVSSQDYDNLYLFWIGEGINVDALMDCDVPECGDDSGPNGNQFSSTLYDVVTAIPADCFTCDGDAQSGQNLFQFWEDSGTGALWLTLMGGSRYCTGAIDRKHSTIECKITIHNADSMLVFETQPSEAQPDIFYIGSQSFDIVNGNHMCNITDQDIGGLIDGESMLDFFDCYCFGNGVESYKIKDSITGHYFNLGNQVTAVAAQDYKEADRYADITYSGVFNNESNVNGLNEFNLGLFNFKACEEAFGSIEILSGRETDVLTLQEDKISYVLAGKNLLSDAAAGGAITSVPEVLGTQIARVEEYGISHNPESFVVYGENKYFTDSKRGAVLQLKGRGAANEALSPISEQGMRSWFRDLFNVSFATQKLGGFDPYMNEYVLTTNDISLPIESECLPCGFTSTYIILNATPLVFCVDLGRATGDWVITWEVISPPEQLEVSVLWNGITTTSGVVGPVNGTLTIPKPDVTPTDAIVTVTTIGNDSGTLKLTVGCVNETEMTIIPVCITSDGEAGLFIHNEWFFIDGTYQSPVGSRAVQFLPGVGDVVSDFILLPGVVGVGYYPPAATTVQIQSAKISPDNFDFDIAQNALRYLVTNTLYDPAVPADITAMLAASTATVVGGGPNYFVGNFVMPPLQSYLYLIYDYRDITPIDLCYSNMDAYDACCDCEVCEECVSFSGTTLQGTLDATCGLVRGTTYFWNGGGVEPELNDVIYLDVGCGIPIVSTGEWMGINAVNTEAIYIDASGQVTNKSGCT